MLYVTMFEALVERMFSAEGGNPPRGSRKKMGLHDTWDLKMAP